MKIGITGGPGSGKTTFAQYLIKYLPNCYIPNMDIIYHNLANEKMLDQLGWRYATADNNKEVYEYIVEKCKEKKINLDYDVDIKEKANIALSKLTFLYTSQILEDKTPQNCDFVIIDFYLLPYLTEFCNLDYSVFLDVDPSIRYNHALERMSHNENREFNADEKNKRIKKMQDYEKKLNINYQIINYDVVLDNKKEFDDLYLKAKQLSLNLLKNYSASDIGGMLKREIYFTYQKIEETSHSYWNSLSKDQIKDKFSETNDKITLLYKEKIITKDMHIKLIKYIKNCENKCMKKSNKRQVF